MGEFGENLFVIGGQIFLILLFYSYFHIHSTMKRRLLAALLLSMLLGTTGVVFAQPGFVQNNAQAIASVEQFVAAKTKTAVSLVSQSDIVDLILTLLAEALLLGGLITIANKGFKTYSFSYTQALIHRTPAKEKARRYFRDDVL